MALWASKTKLSFKILPSKCRHTLVVASACIKCFEMAHVVLCTLTKKNWWCKTIYKKYHWDGDNCFVWYSVCLCPATNFHSNSDKLAALMPVWKGQRGKDIDRTHLPYTGTHLFGKGFHTDSRDRLKPIFATLWLLFQKPLFSNNNKTVLSNTELCSSEIQFKELSCFWKFFVVVGSRNATTTLQKWQQGPNNLHLSTMIQSSPSRHFNNMVNVIHFTCGFNVVSGWWKEKTKTNFTNGYSEKQAKVN